MYRVTYSGLQTLMMEVHEVLAKEERKPMVIDFFWPERNPHDALGAYRFLEMHIKHNNLEVYTRFQGMVSNLDMVITSAVPASNRLLTKSNSILFCTPEFWYYGDVKDANIEVEAHEDVLDKLHLAIESGYNFTYEEVAAMANDKVPVPNEKMYERGFTRWDNLLFASVENMDILPEDVNGY